MELDPAAILLTVLVLGQEGVVREAIPLGAKAFIMKPFKEAHFILTLIQITANAQRASNRLENRRRNLNG